GLSEVEFAIVQVPKDLLSSIAAIPEIKGVARSEVPVPNLLERFVLSAQFPERMRDGIADQHQIVLPGPDGGDLLVVARARRRCWRIGVPGLGCKAGRSRRR